MKAEFSIGKIKFSLNTEKQEDMEDLKIFVNARDVHFSLDDLNETLRSYLKHGHKFKSADEAIESVREEVINILKGKL